MDIKEVVRNLMRS